MRRLFNDPIALMFLYAAAHLFLSRKWLAGSFLFTLGVSIKMNVLLFAPGLVSKLYIYTILKEGRKTAREREEVGGGMEGTKKGGHKSVPRCQ